MADTGYGRTDINTADPEVVELWEEQLYRQALAATVLAPYMGQSSDNIIQEHNNTQKEAGDKLTITLRMQLGADGQTEDEDMEGNEEALTTHVDKFLINELYNAVRTKGKISDQRIPWSIMEEARIGLQDWWAGRIDESLFNQLTGTASTTVKRTGLNAVSAPSTNRWTFAAAAANEAALISNAFNCTLAEIDKMMSIAEDDTDAPLIRPIMVEGEPHFVFFVHPWCARDIRTAANPNDWIDLHKTAGPRMYQDNAIFTGAMGVYNGVIIKKANRVPVGGTADTRRNVLCGAQAAAIGYGQEAAGGRMTWANKMFDYVRKHGIMAGMVFGAKKSVFDSEDFGSIVNSTYATKDGA